MFIEVENLGIYRNDEDKFKADFKYEDEIYKGFSITDPEYKNRERTFTKAMILITLPEAPYKRYGHELYYKFVAAVYPLESADKSYDIDFYKI